MERKEFIKIISFFTIGSGITYSGYNIFRETKEPLKSKLAITLDQQKRIINKITLGLPHQKIESLLVDGYEKAIRKLLVNEQLKSEPINFEFENDYYTPIGKTWINSPNSYNGKYFEQYRKKSLRAWLLEHNYSNTSYLQNNMLQFWLNYFSISDIVDHRYEFSHIKMLYNNCFGNFKRIIENITIDPAMLRFLSGFVNNRLHPNENYARELLELYTIGKPIHKSDYYIESDVREIARSLSGWKDQGWYTSDPKQKVESYFNIHDHDIGEKKLSKFFSDYSLSNNEEKEYKLIISQLFKKDDVSINICSKLYRWFCQDEINDYTFKNLILPISKKLKDSNYELNEVLFDLFTSDIFIKNSLDDYRIKNPLQFIFSHLSFFPINESKDQLQYHQTWSFLFKILSEMGMEILKPPSVGGWKALYQAPNYSKLWINSATLAARQNFISNLLNPNSFISINMKRFLSQSKTEEPKELISYINSSFFQNQLSEETVKHANVLLLEGEDLNKKNLIKVTPDNDWKNNVPIVLNFLLNLPSNNLI